MAQDVTECSPLWQAEGYLNEGLIDAIKNYDPRDGDSSLEQAMDSLQKNVSSNIIVMLHPNELFFKVKVNSGGY